MTQLQNPPVEARRQAEPGQQVEPARRVKPILEAERTPRPIGKRTERRYERKIRVSDVQDAWIQMLIWQHPAHLTQAYPPRFVNNLYMDTPDHSFYVDHVNGVPRRKKVRVRWYGRLEGDLHEPRLEIKSKEGWTVTKQVHPISLSRLQQAFSPDALRRSVGTDECPTSLGEMVSGLQPTLINRYHRCYFQTRDGRVRVTVDTDMSFYHPNRLTGGLGGAYVDRAVIVEIKFAEQVISHGDAVCSHFPLPLGKNSKYINGMQLLHGRH